MAYATKIESPQYYNYVLVPGVSEVHLTMTKDEAEFLLDWIDTHAPRGFPYTEGPVTRELRRVLGR